MFSALSKDTQSVVQSISLYCDYFKRSIIYYWHLFEVLLIRPFSRTKFDHFIFRHFNVKSHTKIICTKANLIRNKLQESIRASVDHIYRSYHTKSEWNSNKSKEYQKIVICNKSKWINKRIFTIPITPHWVYRWISVNEMKNWKTNQRLHGSHVLNINGPNHYYLRTVIIAAHYQKSE